MKHLQRTFSKITVITIAIVLLLGSSIGYANTSFSDVPSNHWALPYIQQMDRVGIIGGYSDGTYKPNLDVPVSQAIVMMVRLIEPSRDDIKIAMDLYGDLLAEVGVEAWAKEQMAYGLYKGIITEAELRNSYINGRVRTAKKLEICRYLTRALGLEDEAKNKEVIILSFNDNTLIPDDEKPYVSMMIDIGVIDQYGDVLGNFNPEGSMNRAIMAKILSVAYDYRAEQKEEAKEKTVTGYIKDIEYGAMPVLTIEDADKNLHQHILANDVIVTQENFPASILDLKVGDWVETKVVGEVITTLNQTIIIDDVDKLVEGTLVSLTITNNIEIKIKDLDGVDQTYRVSPEVATVVDMKKESILHIKAGYPVQLRIENNEVIVIVAETTEANALAEKHTGRVRYVDGTLKAFVLEMEDKTTQRIDTSATTTYINTIADDSSFNAIELDRKVTVIGKVINGRFVAETIVITE